MTLKEYQVDIRATLTVYAENAEEANELALDYCSDLESPCQFEIDTIDDPILKEESS